MEELRQRILRNSLPEPNSGCWLWLGEINWGGYGRIKIGGRRINAHRVSHEAFVGPIPEGLEIDHKCRVRCCVNPAHLEPVTHIENLRRGIRPVRTHCKRGHQLDQTLSPNGARAKKCGACHRIREWGRYRPKRRRNKVAAHA